MIIGHLFYEELIAKSREKPITSKSSAMDIRKEDLSVDTVGKEIVNSDISQYSIDKDEQNNINSESITLNKSSCRKHGKHKKLDLTFQELNRWCIYLVMTTWVLHHERVVFFDTWRPG
jgi:hypothetical protein